VAERIGHRFARSEPRRRALGYLRGLLSDAERKNGWQLAEQLGDATPDGVQHLLARADWDADAVRDDLIDSVRHNLGDVNGVLIVDETGFLKKGTKSCGVARQYSGTAGRIENSQVGVFLAYTGSKGSTLIDRALYLPKEWTGDPKRCREAGVPKDVHFATKIVLAKRMIERVIAAGLPAKWVTADSVYGSDYHFRFARETQGLGYVFGVRSDFTVTVGVRQVRVKSLLGEVPATAWQRLSCGAGSKGPRHYDWAITRINCPEPQQYQRWLLIRRSVSDPTEVAYFACGGPPATTLKELVAVAGKRWVIEECFELAKGDCGLDEYEVRSWVGWHRHVTLSLFALAVVVVIRSRGPTPRRKKGRAVDPAKRVGGAEVVAQAAVEGGAGGRAGAGLVGLASSPPAPGAGVPLQETRGQTTRLTNYGCRIRADARRLARSDRLGPRPADCSARLGLNDPHRQGLGRGPNEVFSRGSSQGHRSRFAPCLTEPPRRAQLCHRTPGRLSDVTDRHSGMCGLGLL
jgi:SRSO17 transposase